MDNNISKIKKSFEEGEINKLEFVELMNQKFKLLFDFQQNLKDSNVDQIFISEKGVIFRLEILGEYIDFLIDIDDIRETPKEVFNFKNYEYNETYFLSKFAENCEIIFDVGSNIGWYSIFFDRLSNVKKIFGFEPLKLNFERFLKNISINKSTKVEAFNIGLSDKNHYLDMYFDKSLTGATSLKNNLNSTLDLVKCEFKTLDYFVKIKMIDKIDLIKIDVEGAELLTILGGKDSIIKFKPIIFVELLRKWAKNFNYHPNDVIELLSKIGYSCFEVTEQLKMINSITDDTISTNFFFLHNAKHIYEIETLKKEGLISE